MPDVPITDIMSGAASGGGIATLIAFIQKYMVDKKIESIKDKLSDHQLHAAETFATKPDLDKALSPINKQLETISAKLDTLSERIPRKKSK